MNSSEYNRKLLSIITDNTKVNEGSTWDIVAGRVQLMNDSFSMSSMVALYIFLLAEWESNHVLICYQSTTRTHSQTSGGEFACPICERDDFDNKANLETHFKMCQECFDPTTMKHHFVCNTCNYTCKDRKTMKNHKKRKVCPKNNVFIWIKNMGANLVIRKMTTLVYTKFYLFSIQRRQR